MNGTMRKALGITFIAVGITAFAGCATGSPAVIGTSHTGAPIEMVKVWILNNCGTIPKEGSMAAPYSARLISGTSWGVDSAANYHWIVNTDTKEIQRAYITNDKMVSSHDDWNYAVTTESWGCN